MTQLVACTLPHCELHPVKTIAFSQPTILAIHRWDLWSLDPPLSQRYPQICEQLKLIFKCELNL